MRGLNGNNAYCVLIIALTFFITMQVVAQFALAVVADMVSQVILITLLSHKANFLICFGRRSSSIHQDINF